MTTSSKTAVLKIMYALRRIKDMFRENKSLKDPAEIQRNMEEASKYLDIIKRQVVVGDLYKSDKLVIDH
ncbi:LYR motif-containing protein 4 isoform X2 [Daktulosphaira vitifoliae]|uniref:LYR motif-containing protein 4 isoform X2 n=1 Tax=Daktulosphaira vitifoliae TaxID=58002 RepID=UPI0021A9BB90|nr:LYR motif-containing protein 4 isoform X2 [Daktulosphaira vitifoliae]